MARRVLAFVIVFAAAGGAYLYITTPTTINAHVWLDPSGITITTNDSFDWSDVDVVLAVGEPPKLYRFGITPVEAGLSVTVSYDSFVSPTNESYQDSDQPIDEIAIHAVTPKGRAVYLVPHR